jgi:hypothetical protein
MSDMDAPALTQSQFERLLTEEELAAHLHVELTLLERNRRSGLGPPHVRVGRRTIRYRPADVERWLGAKACA